MRALDDCNPVIRDVLQFVITDDGRDPEDDLIVCWLDESELSPELPRLTMGF